MLRSLKDLEQYQVSGTDEGIGSVVNFMFDDDQWTVRYLVVEAGGWLGGRRVLISPAFFRSVDWTTKRFHIALTMDQIKNSPGIDVDKPVSRQHEINYYGYYGYPYYWGRGGVWGAGALPSALVTPAPNARATDTSERTAFDIHLRSTNEVRGYHIQGSDAAIGHVADFIVDDFTWQIRYLVIDTSNWWFGKKVLVAPSWVGRVSWTEHKVHVDLSRQSLQSCPEWDMNAAITREYEARLYDHYKRPSYWDGHGHILSRETATSETQRKSPPPAPR